MRSCGDLLGHGRGGRAEQALWPAQVGADAGDGCRSWLSYLWVEPLFQDGLDGSVVRVAVGQRSLAGGVQACLAVGLLQADDPLALPQKMEMMLVEQFVDGGAHMLAKLAGPLATPVRRALEERCLLGWVVIPIRLPLTGCAAQMGLHQLCADIEANDAPADPYVEGLADVAPGDRVEAALDLDVAIACHLGLRPGHDLECGRWQWQHGRLLERLEQQQRRRARRTMVSGTSHPQAPPLRTGVDLRQAAKRATRPETFPHVGNLPLDPRFVFGFCGPCRVD